MRTIGVARFDRVFSQRFLELIHRADLTRNYVLQLLVAGAESEPWTVARHRAFECSAENQPRRLKTSREST
jgi:hypothetical protein